MQYVKPTSGAGCLAYQWGRMPGPSAGQDVWPISGARYLAYQQGSMSGIPVG